MSTVFTLQASHLMAAATSHQQCKHCTTVLAPAVVLLSPVRAVAGKSADGSTYDWAIVSGGPPSTSGKDGCVVGPLNPGPQDVNNSGTLRASKVRTSCATATFDDSLCL